jgi:hypothetical protein
MLPQNFNFLQITKCASNLFTEIQHITKLVNIANMLLLSETYRKVIQILEEIPTELDKMTSCGGSNSAANHEQLLLSLRALLLTASQHSAGGVCRSLQNISGNSFNCSFFYGNSEDVSTLSSALHMSLSCLRALSVWGGATFSPLPDVIGSTDREANINPCESSSGTLISMRLMLSNSSSSEGSYFNTFLLQLRYCLRVLSQVNSNNEGIRSSLGESEMIGVLHFASQLKEMILLSLSILSEWLLVPTPFIDVLNPPPARDIQHQQLIAHQQGEAVRMCQSIYNVYLIVIETWEVLLRSDGGERGIIQWKHILDEHANSTDRTCSSIIALEGAGVTSYGTGVNGRTLDSDSFLNALIGLTVAFAERHLVRTLRACGFLLVCVLLFCDCVEWL